MSRWFLDWFYPQSAEPSLVTLWRRILDQPNQSWVLFRHGTCVIFPDAPADICPAAIGIMKEWGIVLPASSFGDFGIIPLKGGDGWLVTCHHEHIMTMVRTDEIPRNASDVEIGLVGRHKRGEDAHELKIIGVETNKRSEQS